MQPILFASRVQGGPALHQKCANLFSEAVGEGVSLCITHGSIARQVAQCSAPGRNASCQERDGKSDDVEEVIARLKHRFLVTTDQLLADKLALGRSTITRWRRRGSVPPRYARIATLGYSANLGSIAELSPEERAALNLALFRLTKGFAARIVDYTNF